jgi:hypothetical protein
MSNSIKGNWAAQQVLISIRGFLSVKLSSIAS